MTIKFPAAIDTQVELPTVIDNLTSIRGVLLNDHRDAILALENELGIKPSGIYSNVRTRLNAIDIIIGNLQSGLVTFGGDIDPTTPITQTIIGLQGRALLATAPDLGEIITWNGVQWGPAHPTPEIVQETSTIWADGSLTTPSAVSPKISVRSRRRQITTTTASANQVIDNGLSFGTQDFTLSDNTITKINVDIIMKNNSSAEGGSFTLSGTFIRHGAGPIRVGFDDNTSKLIGSSTTGTTANLQINGNAIEIRVSPGSANTFNWRVIRTQIEGQD